MKSLDPITCGLQGTTLIEASAGTGKTYTIATLFLRLLLERELRVSQILVVTYTRAATAELRDRIRRRLTEAVAAFETLTSEDELLLRLVQQREQTRDADRRWLMQAVRDFDEGAISTIHSFCQRTLTECAFESRAPFELELLESDQPLLREVALDYWAHVAYDAQPKLVEALRASHLDPEQLATLAKAAVRDPHMPVLPELVTRSSNPTERFEAACTLAAKLWTKDRELILEALSVKKRLPGQRYQPARMRDSWAPILDGLGGDVNPSDLPEWFSRLTPDNLTEAAAKNGQVPPVHPFFDAMAELLAAAAALDLHVLGLRRAFVDYARAEVARRHRELGTQSFDALLGKLHDALDGTEGDALARRVVTRHPAALIDEFQDTDPIQYNIFRRLYAARSASLFLIGDPKQAIYGFRGADIFAYMQAAKAAQAAYTLDVNFRSDPRLLQATNTLYTRAQQPFLFQEIGFSPVHARPTASEHMGTSEAALQLLFLPRTAHTPGKNAINKGFGDENVPRLVAYEIARLLHSGATIDGKPVAPGDLAVLCRTNKQAADTQDALVSLGIPTVRDGDSSVFDTKTADELAHVLAAVAEPADGRRLGAALCTAMLGVSGEELYRMRLDEAGLELWLDRLARLHQVWHERGFVQMFHQLLADAGVQPRLLRRRDGERRLTDLLHLGELLQRATVEQHLGPLSLLQWFAQMHADPDARGKLAAESAQVRLEHDEHAVKLTTIHRSKGLEYPIVFCPFLWAGPHQNKGDVRFHDRDDADTVKLDIGSPALEAHRALSAHEELAENLRLLYVALTRAKHRSYVVWGRFNRGEGSALGYLLHQDPAGVTQDPPQDSLKQAVQARIVSLSDTELRADLEALCSASGGTIGVRDLDDARPPDRAREEPIEAGLEARHSTRFISGAPRMSSFSRMITEHGQTLSGPSAEGQDHDQSAPLHAPNEQMPTAGGNVVLHAFPAGPGPGLLIHSIYEHIDFEQADAAELAKVTDHWLRMHGMHAAGHGPTLESAIAQSLRTKLSADDPSLTLSAIARSQRLDELEFTLSTPGAEASFSPARLCAAFELHGAPKSAPDYPKRLSRLRALPGSTFLRGFIDLVFRHGERFYIVDYKSNWLGNTAHDYRQERLNAAMREHHYFLQYHLYTLALHRYLRVRVPDYSYAQHFGGVYYLFVRGMAPEHAAGTGIYFDRPELLLIEALATTLGTAQLTAAEANL